MNRNLLNLALLVLVTGMGTAAYYKQKTATPVKTKLVAVVPSSITHASIAYPGKPEIVLDRQGGLGGLWRLTAPVQAPTDPLEILGITNLAAVESFNALPVAGLDLKQLGLAPPMRVITLNSTAIAFGDLEPLSGRRYVQVGNTVMLIEDPPSAALDAEYHDLLAKALFEPGQTIIGLQLPGQPAYSLGLKGWQGPDGSPAPASVAKLVAQWQTAKAQNNETVESPDSGDPITLSLKDGSQRQYIVASTDPQLSLYAPALKVRQVLSAELLGMIALPAEATAPVPAPAAAPSPAPAAPGPVPSLSESLKLDKPLIEPLPNAITAH